MSFCWLQMQYGIVPGIEISHGAACWCGGYTNTVYIYTLLPG